MLMRFLRKLWIKLLWGCICHKFGYRSCGNCTERVDKIMTKRQYEDIKKVAKGNDFLIK